ncbi:MAG TPA: PIG-L family deacetylase [Bacteroidales bacterium]|nr:PIG-L family deacetylase [Bacteroidales bacterium]
MKKLAFFLLLIINGISFAQTTPVKDTRPNMLIITCHPDDWELSMAGTAYLLKDRYHIHIIILSDGELGNTWNTTGKPDPVLGAKRVDDANKTAEKIGATNYFFKMKDSGVYADEEAVNKTITLMKSLDPSIIFIHWPIDKPDHVAASAIAMMALARTGLMYSREVYFFEVEELNHFTPEIFIDISGLWSVKRDLVHFHERYNDDRFEKMAEENAIKNGLLNHCKYAEGFIPLFPLSNLRSDRHTVCTLLDLK